MPVPQSLRCTRKGKLLPAAQATTPGYRAAAASQRRKKEKVADDHAPISTHTRHAAGETCLSPNRFAVHGKENRSPPRNAKAPKNPLQPSEPGRGGDPRAAGAPQQARISPATREDARRFAPCGERRTGYTTCDRNAFHPPDKGSTGVVGGVEGHAPLTPCPSPGGDHASMLGNSRKPAAEIRKKKCRRAGDHAWMPGSSRKPATGKKRKKEKRKTLRWERFVGGISLWGAC